MPAEKPQYLVVIFIDEPSKVKYGGVIAAPVFKSVTSRVMAYHGSLPDPGALTPAQIKGIITRAGKETKIILLGDPNQIDRPYLDDRTNGLSYAAEHMKGSPLCWQITLLPEECERSSLATEAIQRL